MIARVNLEVLSGQQPEGLTVAATDIHKSLCELGFLLLSNAGINQSLLAEVFQQSKHFFALDTDHKQGFLYGDAAENFGYQGLEKESLDPSADRADCKETFTMRNLRVRSDRDSKWPSAKFRRVMIDFYDNCFQTVTQLQRLLAINAGVGEAFFRERHSGENVTLRLLHYPALPAGTGQQEQWGAGAHTDYGMLTLLFQEQVSGLEVLDQNGDWTGVSTDPGEVVVNTGDLMQHWSNGQYPSTLHRVRRPTTQDRYSIAFFADPDSATEIEVLPAFLVPGREPNYLPVKAGEHIQRKLEVTHR
jgi:isopenicillin N synthase-like dioxygenase